MPQSTAKHDPVAADAYAMGQLRAALRRAASSPDATDFTIVAAVEQCARTFGCTNDQTERTFEESVWYPLLDVRARFIGLGAHDAASL